MQTPKLSPFSIVQVVIGVLFILLMVVGDRSQPKIRLQDERVSATDPVVLQFNRPLDRSSLEKGFSLTLNDRAVPGMFSWSALSVAFIPNLPLEQGERYVLTVQGVQDTNGRVLRQAFVREVVLSEPRFLFITPELRLAQGNVNGEQRVVTAEGLQVLSFAVDERGEMAVVASREAGSNRYRLEMVTLKDGSTKLLSASDRYFYQEVALCGFGSDFVAYRKTLDERGTVTSARLVTAPFEGLDRLAQYETELVGPEKLGSTDVLACSYRSRQLVYRSIDGSLILRELGEVEETSLGLYQRSFGFSPDGGVIIVGAHATSDYPIIRSLTSITSIGKRESLSDERFDATDGAMSFTQLLAYSEDRRLLSTVDFQSRLQVIIRSQDVAVREQTILTSGDANSSDERPRWSVDGRYVSFERITLVSDSGVGERPQDASGRLLDGEIWYQVLPNRENALFQADPKPTGLRGGNVVWLP
jgi:hypothetical protein